MYTLVDPPVKLPQRGWRLIRLDWCRRGMLPELNQMHVWKECPVEQLSCEIERGFAHPHGSGCSACSLLLPISVALLEMKDFKKHSARLILLTNLWVQERFCPNGEISP